MEEKNGIEEIGHWYRQRQEAKKKNRPSGAVEVLALRSEISAFLAAGYNIRLVWEYLCENHRMKIAYDTFRKNVNRLILEQEKNGELTAETIDNEKTTKVGLQPFTAKKIENKTFNPANVNLDDYR